MVPLIFKPFSSVTLKLNCASKVIKSLKNDKVNFSSYSQTLVFDQLIPGSYTLNIVGDKNKNDKWDPFDPILFTGPEKRFEYGKSIKIKANWEHDIDFVISP